MHHGPYIVTAAVDEQVHRKLTGRFARPLHLVSALVHDPKVFRSHQLLFGLHADEPAAALEPKPQNI